MQISEINVIDFEKATDPANTPIDKVNKLLQRIGISDYGVIINKPFDEKIYELLIDTYMNGVFSSPMENKILDYVIKIYQKRGVQANKLPAERPNPVPEDIDVPDMGPDFPVQKSDIQNIQSVIDRKLPDMIPFQQTELQTAVQKKWPATPDIKKNVNTIATNIAKQQGWSGPLKQIVMHDKSSGIGFAWVTNDSGRIVINWHHDHITSVTVDKQPVRSGVIDKNIHTLKEEGPRITEQVFRRSGRMYFTTRHADEQRVNRGIIDSKMETAISSLNQDQDWLIYMGMNDYQMGDALSVFDPKSNITMVVVYKRPPLDPVTKEPTEVHPDKPQAINIMTVYHGSPITSTRVPKILKRNNFSGPGGEDAKLTVNQPNKKEFWYLGKGLQTGSIK